MRVFIASCLAAAVIAACVAVVLYYANKPVDVAYTTSSVRL
jgi:hypothetical protein